MPKNVKYKLRRNVTMEEFFWLEHDLKKGTVLYEHKGQAYFYLKGCKRPVVIEPNRFPFFDVLAERGLLIEKRKPKKYRLFVEETSSKK